MGLSHLDAYRTDMTRRLMHAYASAYGCASYRTSDASYRGSHGRASHAYVRIAPSIAKPMRWLASAGPARDSSLDALRGQGYSDSSRMVDHMTERLSERLGACNMMRLQTSTNGDVCMQKH